MNIDETKKKRIAIKFNRNDDLVTKAPFSLEK